MVHRSEILHGAHFQNHYRSTRPDSHWTPLVESFWRLDSYQGLPMGVAEHFLPSLAARLVFPFDNGCYYQWPGHPPRLIQVPHLVPPLARPVTCLHPASRGILGLTLTPGGWAASGHPQAAADILLLPEWLPFQRALAECESFEQQSAYLNTQLPKWLVASCQSDLLIQALAALEKGQTIAQTAAELGLSARSLQRLFGQALGHSPRTSQRVLRLRRTLTGLWQTPGWQIWDSDYCDYSHFFKEFKALMGQSPSAYLRQFAPATGTA